MKKTKKRVLGLLGLILVAITTIFAAFLPGPEAEAANGTTTVTDTIEVRVVGNQPNVEIISDWKENPEVTKSKQSFTFGYNDVRTVSVYLKYTDAEGNSQTYTLLEDYDADYRKNTTYDPPILLDLLDYGYGSYVVTVEGVGFSGEIVSDFVQFEFYPVTGEIEENDDNGLTYLDLDYDTTNEDIHTIKINIYDENGDLVSTMSPITVTAPDTRVELPFSENNLPTGNYRIEISAYNKAGELLYGKPYTLNYYYVAIPIPDTGSLFSNLNISKTDYLITGLLIFLSAAGLGIVFTAKNRGRKTRLGKKRR